MNTPDNQIWNTAEAADNTATVITIAPASNRRVALHYLLFGYDATVTAGRLTVSIGGVTVLSMPVTQTGPGPLPLPGMRSPRLGETVVITLTAAGATTQGSLTSMHTLES